jgi:hypothetical protein
MPGRLTLTKPTSTRHCERHRGFCSLRGRKPTAMTTTKRSDASSVALAEGYYYENGCTVASNVHLTERNYGTRRTFFFISDPGAVQAILPDGWILRATAEPEFHLMVHFNDWLHTSHADNTPHAVQAPPYVGFLVPVQNSFLKRSGIMQVYGFAAGSHYTGGPYKAYRGCTYSHSSRFDTNGLDASWTHDQYKIGEGYAADLSRMCTPHAEPRPMTWARPIFAFAIWRSPASPRR